MSAHPSDVDVQAWGAGDVNLTGALVVGRCELKNGAVHIAYGLLVRGPEHTHGSMLRAVWWDRYATPPCFRSLEVRR